MNWTKKTIAQPLALRYLTSAVDLAGCPADQIPEVAIVGRSNAGKSSLINAISGSRVAKTSSTPGKTRLLNFYGGRSFRWVDMPGYGFAARSAAEQKSWQDLIELFLASRGNLRGLLLVMDIRRDWSRDEEDLLNWLGPRSLPIGLALTKADKLSRSAALQRSYKIEAQSRVESTFVVSAPERTGVPELEEFIYFKWIKQASDGG